MKAHRVANFLAACTAGLAFTLMIVGLLNDRWIDWDNAPLAPLGLGIVSDSASIRYGLFKREIETESGDNDIFVRTDLDAITDAQQPRIGDYVSTAKVTKILAIITIVVCGVTVLMGFLLVLLGAFLVWLPTFILSAGATALAIATLSYYQANRPRGDVGSWENYGVDHGFVLFAVGTAIIGIASLFFMYGRWMKPISSMFERNKTATKTVFISNSTNGSHRSDTHRLNSHRLQHPSEINTPNV